MLDTRRDLAAYPLVARWVDNGWPLIGRRAVPGEEHGIALGLPLPPLAGKGRLSFLMQPEDVIATAPPPTLKCASRVAPRAWGATLDCLDELASQHALEARVFGSLAWRAITGLDYLTINSDLDLLLHVRRDTDLELLTTGLDRIEAVSPMRVDGELVRADGSAVNWRELHGGARELLVKSFAGLSLVETSRFLLGSVAS